MAIVVRLHAAVLGGCVLMACAPAARAAPFSLTDDRGVQVQFQRAPARIVSLLPSLTETVCELGACARLVGTDRFSNWPDAVRRLPKLGGLEDAQVERILALRPDVVLAWKSARVIDRLESLGLRVLGLEPQSLADTRRSVQVLAALLERPEAAADLMARIESRTRDAAARIPPSWRGARVYFEVAAAPNAAGEASFVGELLARLGLSNVVPAALGPFPKLNPEFVIRARPELIMAARDEIAGMLGRPGWRGLGALAAGHVCAFDAAQFEVLVRPGPRLAEAAESIAGCVAALPARARPNR